MEGPRDFGVLLDWTSEELAGGLTTKLGISWCPKVVCDTTYTLNIMYKKGHPRKLVKIEFKSTEIVPVLILERFHISPTVIFEGCEVGTTSSRELLVKNPSNKPVTVSEHHYILRK